MGDPTDFIVIPKIKVIYFSETASGKRLQEGTLNITTHNLLFYNSESATFTLLYTLFEKIEKQTLQDGLRCQLVIRTKSFEEYKFEIPSQEEMNVVAKSIEQLANLHELNNIEVYFPFLYHPRNELSCPLAYPWNGYADVLSRWNCPPGKFVVSDLNRRFTVCPSYPPEVIVPANCTDDNLIESASFRHGCRFPIVVYYNKKTGASLLRSGQPMTGSTQKKCDSDKRLLNACLVPRERGRIMDTRTKSYVTQCTSKGGGTEQPGMYPHWLLEYCDLDRSEGMMMESYEKLFKICHEHGTSSSEAHWITGLSNTKWYSYVMTALQCSLKIAGFLQTDSSSVLIHGATGMDTTLLLSSLTQMILDPYTRRIEGFLELIIREWIFGGYPFRTRTMGLLESTKDKGRAPTFLLFLDCVWQLMRQYARSFEYKETMLLMIHEHTHASEYGTFLANSMKERSRHDLNHKTYSLWAYIHSVRDTFVNPMFEENLASLWPSVYPINILCWSRMFLRNRVLDEETLHFEVKIKELYEKRHGLREKAQQLEDVFLRLKFEEEMARRRKEGIEDSVDPKLTPETPKTKTTTTTTTETEGATKETTNLQTTADGTEKQTEEATIDPQTQTTTTTTTTTTETGGATKETTNLQTTETTAEGTEKQTEEATIDPQTQTTKSDSETTNLQTTTTTTTTEEKKEQIFS